jgi:GAF domain-containing protein
MNSSSIQELDVLLQACTDMDSTIWTTLRHACERSGVAAGTFFRLSPDGKHLTVEATYGVLPWRVARASFPLEQGVCGWTAREKKSTFVNDVSQDSRFSREVDLITSFKTLSVLAAPVIVQGKLFGVLELINRDSHPFTDADVISINSIVTRAANRLEPFQ